MSQAFDSKDILLLFELDTSLTKCWNLSPRGAQGVAPKAAVPAAEQTGDAGSDRAGILGEFGASNWGQAAGNENCCEAPNAFFVLFS
jgi:hypothetical protein